MKGNYLLLNRKLFFVLGVLLVFQQNIIVAVGKQASAIRLEKVFFHNGPEFDTNIKNVALQPIELATMTVYFSPNNPMVNTLKDESKSNGNKELELFFPTAQLQTQEAKNMVDIINTGKKEFFSVRIKEDAKPTQGIKFLISYDPKKVAIKWDSFSEIIENKRPQPGYLIQFFNQELLNQLSSKINRPTLNTACLKKTFDIIIDCGHGGYDFGAVGFENLKEKDVVLAVGTQVADLLKKKGFNVMMTRQDDLFVALDARTTLANKINQADVFLSIHANSSKNMHDIGIETFYFNPSLLKPCFNSLSDDCKKVAYDQECKRSEQSKLLAQLTHDNLLAEIKKKNTLIVDRKTQKAVLQVLVGSSMPAALVEIGFLSNKQEATLLADKQYQKQLAQGIYNGIVSYIDVVKRA